MQLEVFRKQGKVTIDYMVDYFKNIDELPVISQEAVPGFLKNRLPTEAPEHPEPFENILKDVTEKIMPGVLHWNHPKFFAYFSSGNSCPSILGEMLSAMFGTVGFTWNSCPSQTELEEVVMNWYAKAIGLPDFYITNGQRSKSGACIQNTASDSIYICVMGARARALKKMKELEKDKKDVPNNELLPKLTAYFSREAHSSTEKAINMAYLNKRVVPVAEDGRMRADKLKEMINEDMSNGFTPCLVVATLGSTSACIMDDLQEIGPVCKEIETIWFHVDAAYAGSALMLPEKKHLGAGLEFSDSFNTNAYKFMLVNCDCAAMWVKDIRVLKSALAIDALYLKHVYEGKVLEYRNYGIALSRRFRALKLWMVFRCYGVSGLQKYMRNHCTLARKFASLMAENKEFILWNKVQLGLVCFRLAAGDEQTRNVCAAINKAGVIHLTLASFREKIIIRVCVTYEHATEEHIVFAWEEIQKFAKKELAGEAEFMSEEEISFHTNSVKVSKEVYMKRRNELYDFSKPVLFCADF